MNEKYKEFLEIVDVPTKSHLLNIGDEETLNKYRVLRTEIEDELKELKEFARIVATKGVDSFQAKSCKDDYDYNNWIDFGEYEILSKREFYLVKKVVEKYGNQIEY